MLLHLVCPSKGEFKGNHCDNSLQVIQAIQQAIDWGQKDLFQAFKHVTEIIYNMEHNSVWFSDFKILNHLPVKPGQQ